MAGALSRNARLSAHPPRAILSPVPLTQIGKRLDVALVAALVSSCAATAVASASCPLPEGSTLLVETNFMRVIEEPGPGDPVANLTGCLHSAGTRLTLASRYANKNGKGSYALIGVGYTFVGFRVRVTDRNGRAESAEQVVDLRDDGPPRGGGSRATEVIDLVGNRIAWIEVAYTSTGRQRRFVRAAGPQGTKRLASGRAIALHRLSSKGRRVYWRQDGRRRTALVA